MTVYVNKFKDQRNIIIILLQWANMNYDDIRRTHTGYEYDANQNGSKKPRDLCVLLLFICFKYLSFFFFFF